MCSCQATSAESRAGLFAIFHNRKDMVRGLLGYGRGSDMLGSEVDDWGG